MSDQQPVSVYQQIYALVRLIPPGHVSSYGRIGQIIGCTARSVGFAMAALPTGSDVPWQRVINAQGKVSPRTDGQGNILQRDLLEAEGIIFNSLQQVDLNRYLWKFPQTAGKQD